MISYLSFSLQFTLYSDSIHDFLPEVFLPPILLCRRGELAEWAPRKGGRGDERSGREGEEEEGGGLGLRLH